MFCVSVSLLENIHDHNALATTPSELLGPTLWTSRYVHCSHPVLYICIIILETLNFLGPCKHPVGLFITLVDLLLTPSRKLPSERQRGGAEAVQ